jgi:hypothetical protein
MSTGAKVITISPSAWQAYIGNKNPTKDEKSGIRLANPGYADSWNFYASTNFLSDQIHLNRFDFLAASPWKSAGLIR